MKHDLIQLAEQYPGLTISVSLDDLLKAGRTLCSEIFDYISDTRVESSPAACILVVGRVYARGHQVEQMASFFAWFLFKARFLSDVMYIKNHSSQAMDFTYINYLIIALHLFSQSNKKRLTFYKVLLFFYYLFKSLESLR